MGIIFEKLVILTYNKNSVIIVQQNKDLKEIREAIKDIQF